MDTKWIKDKKQYFKLRLSIKNGNNNDVRTLFSARALKKEPTASSLMIVNVFWNTACRLSNDLEHTCAQSDWGLKYTDPHI